MNMISTIIRKSLLSVSRRSKRLIIASTDFFLFLTASFVSLALNQQSLLVFSNSEFLRIIWIPLLGVFIFTILGVYKSIVRFIEFTTISRIVVSTTLVFVIDLFLSPYLEEAIRQLFPFILKEKVILTRESWVIGFLLSLVY